MRNFRKFSGRVARPDGPVSPSRPGRGWRGPPIRHWAAIALERKTADRAPDRVGNRGDSDDSAVHHRLATETSRESPRGSIGIVPGSWRPSPRVVAVVAAALILCSGCRHRLRVFPSCPDGLPPEILIDPACPPDGVCGYSCLPGRWELSPGVK